MSFYQNSGKKRRKTREGSTDNLANIGVLIGRGLYFFCVEPYKGIKQRIQSNGNHLTYILLLQTVGVLLYLLFLDRAFTNFFMAKRLDTVVSWYWLYGRGLFVLWVIAHLYLLFWRLPWLKKESRYNRGFIEIGLVPSYKSKPISFITEYPLDQSQWRVVLSNPGLPLSSYKEKKEAIEATFDFTISEISFGKSQHVAFMDYTKKEFPKLVASNEFYKDLTLRPYEFGVGLTIGCKKITCTLRDMVHLLVAGETGGGKSTFLRQFIVDCLRSKKTIDLYLVDLKGGVEFQTFQDYKRVTLIKSFADTAGVLQKLNDELDRRLRLLEEARVNNIEAYEEAKKITLSRAVLAIDECAEIFLHSSSQDSATKLALGNIRFLLGRLARLSRAVGIHLVLATQRADKEAVDMQTKDNLVSRLCFRVNNDYASQMVLRDGRAARLPRVKGRAIWKDGDDELEVQIPYLDQKDVAKALEQNGS